MTDQNQHQHQHQHQSQDQDQSQDENPAVVQQAVAWQGGTVNQAARDIVQLITPAPSFGDEPGMHSIAPPVGRLPAAIRGRDALLDELTRAPGHAHPRVYVLHGLGGCGKTTVALEVARRLHTAMPVWWISAAEGATLSSGMRQLALALGADVEQVRLAWSGWASASDLVWSLLDERPHPWLLVVDNADDPDLLAPAHDRVAGGTGWIRRPRSARGTVLVTRRSKEQRLWGHWAALRAVDPLSPDDGAHVLFDLAGESAGSRADARSLAADLQGLPLALRLAGAYLRESVTSPPWPGTRPIRSFAAYQETLRSRFTLLDTSPPGQYDDRTQQELITRTWELSLDLLHSQGKDRPRPLLRLLAHLADAPVPFLLLLDPEILSDSPVVGSLTYEQLHRALTSLADLGLIDLATRPDPDPDDPLAYTLSLHALVRATNREHPQVVARRPEYLGILGASMHKATDAIDPDEPEAWPAWQLLAPHASGLLELLATSVDIDREAARTLARAAQGSADYFGALGMYERAEAEYRAVLDVQRLVIGEDHPDTLTTRHNLAYTLRDRGLLDQAETVYQGVLAARRRILGEGHQKTLVTRNQLARVHREQGRYDEAEAEFRSVLEAQRGTVGAEHPDTLVTRSNLASMYFVAGRLADAEAEYRDVLETERRVLGEDHIESLVTHGNLARVLAERGLHGRAETEYRAVLAAETRVLGEDHPDTLTTRHNLARALAAQGRRAEAEEQYGAVLELRERLLGAEHPNTRQTRAALARLAEPAEVPEAREVPETAEPTGE
ncbi:tetratricopeptide repeat protein [Streptomyces sp. NPDC026672]|uniref:tetratricopeptide repeat protein n=1 Tax=unclassified Streptomyces TaxID=2593676 RepID=UPI0033CC2158